MSAAASGITQVNLTWSASAGATGYFVERTSDGTHYQIFAATTSASFSDALAVPATPYYYRIIPYNGGGFGTGTTSARVTTASTNVPAPWDDSDIGVPYVGGYGNFDSSSAMWTVAGGGADIYGNTDEFNFLSQPLAGDAALVGASRPSFKPA